MITTNCLGGDFSTVAFSPLAGTALFSGSMETHIFSIPNSDRPWASLPEGASVTLTPDDPARDSLTDITISVDGTVALGAVNSTESGGEVFLINLQNSKKIKIYNSPLFPIRSVSFGSGGRRKTAALIGIDDGTVVEVSLKTLTPVRELKPLEAHGGVKCVRTHPLTGAVAVSYCDGAVCLFTEGGESEMRKIFKSPLLPESPSRFGIDWNPARPDILAVTGRPAPSVLVVGSFPTVPLDATEGGDDGPLSVVKWSVDGTLLAGVTGEGVVKIFKFDFPLNRFEQVARILPADTTTNRTIDCFLATDGTGHVINTLSAAGRRGRSLPATARASPGRSSQSGGSTMRRRGAAGGGGVGGSRN
jgi:WD40 repeat protein